MTLKHLPVEGALFKELRVWGNAKDCYVEIETTNPDGKIHFGMSDPLLQLDFQGRVQSIIFEDGSDTTLGVKYLPLERLKVDSFVVDYPGSEAEWRKALRDLRKGQEDPFDWAMESGRVAIIPTK